VSGIITMNRRHALHTLASTAAAVAAPLGVSTSAQAKPALAADFDAAVASQALLRPFKGVTDQSGDRDGQALMRGRWPTELRGRFYRNGPALFERNGQRYHHWFDGDGMVQQFTMGDAGMSHRGRLVRTEKLRAEQKAGRFLMSALGTTIDDGLPGTGPDAFNVANTNALEHGGRVLAMWEGGSAYALDPQDLATQGPVTWAPGLQQVPFSAHPKVDSSGHLWNIGTQGSAIVAWHIDPQGKLAKVQVGKSPYPGGMVHDMAITERYLVVPLPPVSLAFSDNPGAQGGPRRFAMKKGEPLRVLVMEKNDITRSKVFELPAQFVFHVGNAHETRDGHIALSYVGAPDAWFLDRGAVALMAGRTDVSGHVNLQMARLDMASGRATVQSLPGNVEFPRIHPQRIGVAARWLLSAASWSNTPSRPNSLLHGLQLLDTDTGRAKRFDYGDQVIVEEHIVVPKPGKTGELDAWLLGTTYDARRQATVLNVLDAAHIEDGPIAQAVLPYMLPLGFHGNFTAA
jgi:all-trans-8'-apo-beta-carotenal 15,15'-oxygenase